MAGWQSSDNKKFEPHPCSINPIQVYNGIEHSSIDILISKTIWLIAWTFKTDPVQIEFRVLFFSSSSVVLFAPSLLILSFEAHTERERQKIHTHTHMQVYSPAWF